MNDPAAPLSPLPASSAASARGGVSPPAASFVWTWWPVAAAFAVLAAFYTWTTVSNHLDWHFGAEQRDHYNLLVHGFLDGHLSLKEPVPEALLRSPDPYDPAQRPDGAGLHDASLYQGKYYIYYGVVPAVVALWPFRLIAGFDLPVPVAVLGFALAALAVGLLLIGSIRRRYFPACGPGSAFLVALAFGFATCAPLLVRRSNIYELPITSGSLFALTALATLYAAIHQPNRRTAWIAATSLAWGLAIGCRPTYLFAPLGAALAFWAIARRERRGIVSRPWLPMLVAAVVPISAVGLLLAWYNYARFGRVTEFGVSYILSGVYEAKIEHFRLRYVPWNAYAYLFAPGGWSWHFPFFHDLAIGWSRPRQHFGMDVPFGLLANVPLLWLGVLAVFPLRRIAGLGGEFRAFVGATIWAALATAAFLMCFYAAMARYLGDFAPALAITAAIGAMAIIQRAAACSRIWRRRLVRTIVGGYAAATVFMVSAASVQLYSRLKTFNPDTYAALERAFDRPIDTLRHWFGQAR